MTATPLASWYTQGTSDGLGDRLLMFDNTSSASLELLRFRPEFAAAPGFERALRESVERLFLFKHPAFAQVRAVEFLDGDDGLALVSTHAAGKRLAAMFQGRQPRGGMHPAFVTWLIRQLTPAVFDLQAQGRGIAHGALTVDRIVLTPDGQLVIVEHVLGAALSQLRLSARQLWEDLGVVAVSALDGVPRLDTRADIRQLGLVALSVLLGRRITPEEYPARLERLLDEFSESASRRSPALVPPLRLWLERALRLDGHGFNSAAEACDGLRELPGPAGRQVFEHFHAARPTAVLEAPDPNVMDRTPASQTENTTSLAVPPADLSGDKILLSDEVETPAGLGDSPREPQAPSTRADRAFKFEMFVPDPFPPTPPSRAVEPAWAMDESDIVTPQPLAERPVGSGLLTGKNVAIAVGVVALLEAGALVRLATRTVPATASVPAAVSIPVTIDSPVAGDVVMVDGHQVGLTPFQLNIDSGGHSIRVISMDRLEEPVKAAPTLAPVPATRTAAEVRTAALLAQAASRQRSGGLQITSPVEIQVLEGDRVLGSSADGPIVAPEGVHQLELINLALGYRSRQTVEVKAGQIIPLIVKPPDGKLSVNALPWAQVWIDGTLVGETPLANLSLPIGQHEIVFRHPQFGEKRETVITKSGAAARISATLGR